MCVCGQVTSGLHSPARPVLVQLSFRARGWEGKHSGGGRQKRQREGSGGVRGFLSPIQHNMTQRRPSRRSPFKNYSQAPSVIALCSHPQPPSMIIKKRKPSAWLGCFCRIKQLFFFCFPLNQGFCVPMQNFPFSFFKIPPGLSSQSQFRLAVRHML